MPDLVFKQWDSVIDARTTLVCLTAAGQIQPVNSPFDTLMGAYDAPPAHVHCRAFVSPYVLGMINTVRAEANTELQKRPLKDRDQRKAKLPPPPD